MPNMTFAVSSTHSESIAAHRKLSHRRFPVGAEVQNGGVHFRVWAPRSSKVDVVLADEVSMSEAMHHPLASEENGYFSGLIPEARTGQHYRLALDRGEFPDPVSRFQPEGPHGPSRIVDSSTFAWTDAAWRGVRREGQIIYEFHIGTFTKEGTWTSATEKLSHLKELGVTLLEVMPVSDFPGKFGWGYDGVNMFAPTRLYGEPDDFRRFVDCAHSLGLGVILDVVYNHFGPDGNYLREFSEDYFSTRYENEWGDPINFDGKNSGPVREFFATNAAYWIDEFHLDGLRFDATQQIFDDSKEYIVAEIARSARKAAGKRIIFLVAENEPQDSRLARIKENEGHGLDALWNDDFHHSAMVALTGQREAYYTDYCGKPQEFVSAAKWGFLFQGQRYHWQKQRRGTSALDLEPSQFVNCIQNHDQVANSLSSRRIHELANPAQLRAMTALLLLNPATPMLFQGQEFASSSPFYFFADHHPELARLVGEGRRTFLSQFPSAAAALKSVSLENPEREETFVRSKLDWSECARNHSLVQLHADLIRIRREDPVISKVSRASMDGAVLSDGAFLLRYFSKKHGDRLLVFNFGTQLENAPAPEPLLAPPGGSEWELCWSSENPRYGGPGMPLRNWSEDPWMLLSHSAVLLIAKPYADGNEPRSKD
jgi:maltooligosyltrehalose trehalohydrolase